MLHWTKDASFVIAAFVAAGVLLPIVQLTTALLVLAAMLAAAVLVLDWAVENVGLGSWKAMIAEGLVAILMICFVVLVTCSPEIVRV